MLARLRNWMVVGIFVTVPAILTIEGEIAAQSNELTIYAGYTCYNDPALDSLVPVEFPFVLNRSQFEFFSVDSTSERLQARVFVQLDLIDNAGFPVDSAKTYFSVYANSAKEALQQDIKLFDNLGLMIRPGLYAARLTVIDVTSKREGRAFYDTVKVEPTITDRLMLGGAELAYSVTFVGSTTGVNPRLVKSGFLVYPNPIGVFSVEDTAMCLFAELHNLQYDSLQPTQYKVSYLVENDLGAAYRDYGYRLSTKAGASSVIAESFDLKGFEAGVYNLRITVVDLASDQSVTRRLPLRVVSPAAVALASRFGPEGSFDPYDTLDTETKINLVAYKLTADQKVTMDNLSREGKLNFLDRFWSEQDEDPTTPIIENRLELIRRYEFANLRYSSNVTKTNGWATDRGRIYMTYGQPDELDERLMPTLGSPETSTLQFVNPYEVWWYYSLKGGTVFVFEDEQGYGDYTLVHSNADGEVYSDEWFEALREQYIDLE